MIRHQRRLLRRNKDYSRIRVSWIKENLNGEKPPKMGDSRCTQYTGMAYGPALPSTTFGGNEPGLHQSNKTRV